MLKRWFVSSQSTDVLREWVEKYMELKTCTSCNGARLKKESLWFKVEEKNIAELSAMNLDKLVQWFESIEERLSDKQNSIAKDVLKEIRERLQRNAANLFGNHEALLVLREFSNPGQ